MRRGLAIVGVLCGAVLLSAPALGAQTTTTSAEEYPEVTITIRDNNFSPKRVEIEAGTTVRWINVGSNRHDVIGVTGKSFESKTLKNGDEFEHRFDKPGTYKYYCSFHGAPTAGQRGVIVVHGEDDSRAVPASSAAKTSSGKSRTIRVPQDAKTIQGAVNQAEPGDLILVSPGVYHEAVIVTTSNLVIRGLDRAKTILDGQFKKKNGVFVTGANAVAVENLTARNYQVNGFYWNSVIGYRGSYLTAYRNGDYGIYAFDSIKGQFDHSYGAGSPDAGFYIGQCFPCDAVITDSEAEWNGLGYSGTNAGGNLLIVNSSFHDNRAGIVPNSGTGEELAPERETTIVGNRVENNNNQDTASISIAEFALGNGILLAGGNDNVVERNLVANHDISGISVIALPETLINPDDPNAKDFDAHGNRVQNNVVRDSKEFDLGLVASLANVNDTAQNCFSGNTFTTSLPPDLEKIAPCAGAPSGAFTADIGKFAALLGAEHPGAPNYRKVKLPKLPKLPNMPNAKKARAQPATNVPMKIDLAAIQQPS